jgi:hypothetical protein
MFNDQRRMYGVIGDDDLNGSGWGSAFEKYGPGDGGALNSFLGGIEYQKAAFAANQGNAEAGSNKYGEMGYWLQTSYRSGNAVVVNAKFVKVSSSQQQTQGNGPGDGFEKFGVYDAIGFGADMSELYRQGYGAVQFGMRLGKAEQLLADARILKTMTASRTAFNTSVSAFKTAGKGIAVVGGIAAAAEFLTSDRSGGDYAKLGGSIVIIGTAFIPVVGPFISVGLGLLDGAGAFDGLYRLAD